MKKRSNHKRVCEWALAKLQEHPRQRELFADLPDPELKQLAADMQKQGLQHPIEVLPDGTIVAGHQRVRAAKLLGWEKIDVVVRADLAAAGGAAVESYLIRDNFLRRQSTPLGKARCIQGLIEIESGRDTRNVGWREFSRLKKSIAEQLGMTDRNVGRYILLLKAPMEVQEAFDRGELTLTDAGRVGLLNPRAQQLVGERIADGESAKEVVKEALAKGKGDEDGVRRPLCRLIGALQREVPQLKGRVNEMAPGGLAKRAPLLLEAKEMIDEMLRRGERAS